MRATTDRRKATTRRVQQSQGASHLLKCDGRLDRQVMTDYVEKGQIRGAQQTG